VKPRLPQHDRAEQLGADHLHGRARELDAQRALCQAAACSIWASAAAARARSTTGPNGASTRRRFKAVTERYGYLAKQFTVFGQHIHLGCASGDEAVYLVHMLTRYMPHFIALSAASPFYQGEDTSFQSSRLTR
jgi:carboxylate-amine ligase